MTRAGLKRRDAWCSVLRRRSRIELVEQNVIEGCVSETLAAAELRERAGHARRPDLRDGLRRMSADEAEHAELAFRILQ